MTYAEKLKDPRWQKKRLEILERDNWCCQLCFDKNTTLHVHHLKYSGEPWNTKNDDLLTYCEHCHSIIEFNKKEEKIIPLKVFKGYIDDNQVKLCLVYFDENGGRYVDVYIYNKKGLFYKTSISDNLIHDLYQHMIKGV